MSIERKVVRVQTSGQLSLLEEGDAQETAQPERHMRFDDPDPDQIYYADQKLRVFLEEGGLEFAFVMRRLFRQLDWSAFEARYTPGGRPPYAPVTMVSLIVYGMTQGVDSFRGLEALCKRDLVCHWLSGGICPDHTTFCRFIGKHADQLATSLFEQVTAQIIEYLPEVDRQVHGDGTVIESAATRFNSLKKDAIDEWVDATPEPPDDEDDDEDGGFAESRQARRCKQVVDERIEKRRASRSKNPEDVQVSPSDPESVFHKLKRRNQYAFAWIASVQANRQRLILAQTVHPSSETAVVAEQIEQTKRLIGKPDVLGYDAGYFCYDVIREAASHGINLLCPSGSQDPTKPAKTPKKFSKWRFEYQPDTNTMQCPAGESLSEVGSGHSKTLEQDYRKYGTDACNAGCELRDSCTEAKKGRRINRYEDDWLVEAMHQVMNQPRARRDYKQRQASVEPVFAELKHLQGLRRLRSRGLKRVQTEFSLHAMAHNLRRLEQLLKKAENGLLSAIFAPVLALMSLIGLKSAHHARTDLHTQIHQARYATGR
jgi:transposase